MTGTTETPVREVRLGSGDVVVERRANGSFYARSPHALGSYPEKMTERLEYWAAKAPDRVFVAQRGPNREWRKLTYGECGELALPIAQALIDRKLSAERPVAILSGNDIEHALLAFGAMYAGIPYVPISPAYSLISSDFSKLRYIFGLVTPGFVFANGAPYQRAISAVVPQDIEVVTGEDFPRLTATRVTSDVAEAHAKVGPDTIVKILLTSGSTGMPKGVINTQRMWSSNQEMVRHCLATVEDEPPVIVDWLPWNHTFGANHDFGLVLYNGGSMYIDEGRPLPGAIEETVRNLREIAPTIYFNVPKGYEALIPYLEAEPALRERFFSRLKVMFYAAASLSQNVWDDLERLSIRTCGERIRMVTGYGATETAPLALFGGKEINRAGMVGVPVPGVELKLTPVEGKLEARLRGPVVTPGYWRQPELTREAFDEEGFYRLGDALKFADPEDPRKGFVFDGRIAEDFKLSSGNWVSTGPLRVEFITHCAPYVRDVVIAGHDRDEVTALIFPDIAACRGLCPGLSGAAPAGEIVAADPVRAKFGSLLQDLARQAGGSSHRIARALLLTDPPSLDAHEITDKGSLNQRAVLEQRAALVEELYSSPRSPRVISIDRGGS
jgi:feruloyl-CoA synthase